MDTARWNFDATDTDILVCRNNHEKGDDCDYERMHPKEVLQLLTAYRESALESESLRKQLTAALAACEAKAEFLQFAWRDIPMSEFAFLRLEEAIAIKPDASALNAHDAASSS